MTDRLIDRAARGTGGFDALYALCVVLAILGTLRPLIAFVNP